MKIWASFMDFALVNLFMAEKSCSQIGVFTPCKCFTSAGLHFLWHQASTWFGKWNLSTCLPILFAINSVISFFEARFSSSLIFLKWHASSYHHIKLPSSAKPQPSWAELALISLNPTTHPPYQESLFLSCNVPYWIKYGMFWLAGRS